MLVDSFNREAVIDRACRSKHDYPTPGDARAAAREASRRSGDTIRSYRCPFGDGCWKHAHWHIGHLPSLDSLRDIARAIREHHQGVALIERAS
jgi:hypothetical protein